MLVLRANYLYLEDKGGINTRINERRNFFVLIFLGWGFVGESGFGGVMSV